MQQKSLKEVARLINLAITMGDLIEAQWGETKIIIVKAEYENTEDGEHLYGYDTEGKKYCIGGAKISKESQKENPPKQNPSKKWYENHPLYSRFMSTVISGHRDDTEESFNEFIKEYGDVIIKEIVPYCL